jgi:opine dehydrogenase
MGAAFGLQRNAFTSVVYRRLAMIETIAIIGAGNGGKAAAVDLALQNKHVRLFEFPEFKKNLQEIIETKTLTATGAVEGQAHLDRITCDLEEALAGVDSMMICTQALTHDRVAHEIAPFVRPEHLIILNPGSTGGSLHFAHVFRKLGLQKLPTIVETSTLTYGCRAKDARVEISVKVKRVAYATLPAKAAGRFGPELEALYPGLVRSGSVLEAGLNNANPVIHPPITILNGARIENEGDRTYFYKDGVSPTVAHLIRKLDEERMALLEALGYAAQPDPVTSVEQGYASSREYYECYKNGPGFKGFRNPNTLDNRYIHEDIGMGLVMFCSLGRFLKIPTPTCQAFVSMGEAISGINYSAEGKRTLNSMGLAGLTVEQLKTYLESGEMPTI